MASKKLQKFNEKERSQLFILYWILYGKSRFYALHFATPCVKLSLFFA